MADVENLKKLQIMNNSIEATNAKLKLCEDKIMSLKNMILERDEKLQILNFIFNEFKLKLRMLFRKPLLV